MLDVCEGGREGARAEFFSALLAFLFAAGAETGDDDDEEEDGGDGSLEDDDKECDIEDDGAEEAGVWHFVHAYSVNTKESESAAG